jgi:hypothetical protein
VAEFDPVRAQKEVVTGMMQVAMVIKTRTSEAQRKLGEAEAELNAMMKINGYIEASLAAERIKLKDLTDAAEADGK